MNPAPPPVPTSTWIWRRNARAMFGGGAEGAARLAYARASQIAALAAGALFLLPIVFLLAALLHSRTLGGVGLLAIATSLAAGAAAGGFKIWWVSRRGVWTGWKGQPISRHGDPARFWRWTALHALSPTISSAGAVATGWFGVWLLLGGGFR